jgi:hypothetical protein
MLLDSDWPDTLLQLKQKYRVYALTKMDTGQFGNIKSMEEWRYSELKSLGIEFSDNGGMPQKSNGASFYNGLFITGPNSKSQTISHYLPKLKADTFVMIDDREEHLEDIRQFCEKNGIRFIGILFSGLEKFRDMPNHDVALLQKRYLIKHARWLEDEEAENIINQTLSTLPRSKL